MSVQGGPDIITDGLVTSLDSASPKSYPGTGSSWKDLSGQNRHATLLSLTINGSATTFESNFEYIATSSGGSLYFKKNGGAAVGNADITTIVGGNTNTRTYEAWFNSRDTSSQLVLGVLGYNSGIELFGGRIYLWSFHRNAANTTFLNASIAGPTYTTNRWYHVINILSPNQSIMYVNGQLYSSVAITDFLYFVGGGYKVGGTYYVVGTAPSQYQYDASNAEIPVARIYNRVLSASEVLNNYNANRSRFGL